MFEYRENKLFYSWADCFRSLLRASSGSAVVLTAIALPVLLGFAGLAVDVTSWYVHKRMLQSAANAAAVAASLESVRGMDGPLATLAASSDAARNGFRSDRGDTISVHVPPLSGGYASKSGAAEVVLRRLAPVYFSRGFVPLPVTIGARAVAAADSEGANTCLWVLDRSQASALKVAGGAQVELDCGIVVNSSDTTAVTQNGTGSCLTASRIRVVGGVSGDCINASVRTGIRPVDDPLASLAAPAFGGCDTRSKTKVNSGQRKTIDPGVYCADIDVMGGGELTLNPGTYVLDGAGLKIAAQATVNGSGVFFYSTENSGTSAGTSISGGAYVNLSAPRSGKYAGMLFFHSRTSPGNVTHSFTGGSTMQLDGTLYFPNQDVAFSGGSDATQTSSVLVVRTISFTGHSHVDIKIAENAAARTNRLMYRASLVE